MPLPTALRSAYAHAALVRNARELLAYHERRLAGVIEDVSFAPEVTAWVLTVTPDNSTDDELLLAELLRERLETSPDPDMR